jgi:Mn-dependent DtxR family transcriptional regulator
MPASGELIRMMNYMDDITATLRRIITGIPFMTEEERKRLAAYMRKADPSVTGMIERLEKGEGK